MLFFVERLSVEEPQTPPIMKLSQNTGAIVFCKTTVVSEYPVFLNVKILSSPSRRTL